MQTQNAMQSPGAIRPPATGSILARGLTSQQARARLAEFGPNEPTTAQATSGVVQFLLFFLNPLVIILLIAGTVSAFLGEFVNASIIMTLVLLSSVMNFVQTYRSHRAVDRLREGVAPTALVLRDGNWVKIPRAAIVPADL